MLLAICVATVLIDRKSFMDAYTLCHEVLSQLGEEIPESLQSNHMSKISEATSNMLKSVSDSDLLEMKEMDERLSISMHFYNIISNATYFAKPEMLPFIACRMVQLTMEKVFVNIQSWASFNMRLCFAPVRLQRRTLRMRRG